MERTIITFLILVLMGCTNNDDITNLYPSDFLNYRTQTNLKLPFNEEFFIGWGGRTIEQNYHAEYREQRFAIDIVQMINGNTHTGSGNNNSDYYCFGKTLISPGEGTIIELLNSVDDNIPGSVNSKQPAGNYIIIEHYNKEYSFIGHLKKNSIIVNVGDKVTQGQELAKIGNSGQSSEPHIHYHMQNTSNPLKGDGLPTQFLNYYSNDIFITRGEPVKNEKVRNQ